MSRVVAIFHHSTELPLTIPRQVTLGETRAYIHTLKDEREHGTATHGYITANSALDACQIKVFFCALHVQLCATLNVLTL